MTLSATKDADESLKLDVVYIGETERCMHERIKEHNRDIRLSRIQTAAVTENANEAGHYLPWDKKVYWPRPSLVP